MLYFQLLRLPTLSLAIIAVVLGNCLAYLSSGRINYFIFILTLLTALILQILSNVVNDYGDAMKNADLYRNKNAPKRITISADKATKNKIKNFIYFLIVAAFFSGSLLLFFAADNLSLSHIIFFIIIGILAILAACFYTVGIAYAYRGFGEVSVFIFFGIVAVLGSFFLQTGFISLAVIFPAMAMGFFACSVLNFNNIRDIDGDRIAGKNTLSVKLGFDLAKYAQVIFILAGFLSLAVYSFIMKKYLNLYYFSALLFVIHYIFLSRKIFNQASFLYLLFSILTVNFLFLYSL
ncbi:MAG: 1,4-dihydroxy-2-naphthoate octaprenyltransferase [Cardiobacteriaceae bacterium]|nr:1,4-dihydroxy-2-naphthoate octaprenyltransferase [Cardiobacteriaceae bacterium]